jgi:hypothetical protein
MTTTTATPNTTYTTTGGVRGCCDHRHLTIATALKCLERDQRACWRLGGGGYSDRAVVAVDGSHPNTGRPYTLPLTASERDDLDAIIWDAI